MIEINLLPGARKQKRSRSASFDLGAAFGGMAARIRDPYLIAAAASVLLAALAVGGMFLYQNSKSSALAEHELTSTQDSTRYSAVIAQRRAAEEQRDSVVRQINVIRAIDGARYVWPHILDEVSKALTPYTWLKTLVQTSAVASISPEVEAGLSGANAKNKTKLEAKADSEAVAASALTFRIVGQTIDIQALTRFYTQLEASPFIENVVLVKTENVMVQPGNRTAIEFTLDMRLQKADSAFIRRVPLSVAVH